MKSIYFLIFISGSLLYAEPNELAKLEKTLTEAQTNIGMKQATWNLYQYFEKTLVVQEKAVLLRLPIHSKPEFKTSMRSWRSYRESMALVKASFWQGGSGYSLVKTSVLLRLTKAQVKYLESISQK